jgi:paraquat-inducible protein B
VWSVPLAALLIVGYLGIQALAKRGIDVTVTFNTAAGASPGNTKVTYQGVDIGTLEEIVPNKDNRRIDFKLRLDPRAKSSLNSNARFWLIGASPNFTDLSSLKAAVEGVAIGFAPGNGGEPERRFIGLDKAPIVLPGDRGTRFVLKARNLGSVREGSEVLFHGMPIGKVTQVKFRDRTGFTLEVFIFQPYDALIKPDDLFWTSSPLQLSFGGGTVDADLAPISTVFGGGIDVDIRADSDGETRSPDGAEFILYPSQNEAEQQLSGPAALYDLAFSGAAGDLSTGAPVTLLGFRIGEVKDVRLAYDAGTGKPYTAVTALLYLGRLDPGAAQPAAAPGEDRARRAIDDKLRALLRLGYRARLKQTPALVGARAVALVPVHDAPPAQLSYDDGAIERIPSAAGSTDIEDITAQADQLLTKVNHIPLEKIGGNLSEITSRLKAFADSPKLEAAAANLNDSLTDLSQMLNEVRPQVGPLLAKLNQTADQLSQTVLAAHQLLSGEGASQDDGLPEAIGQLTEAARSLRSLADYLERHPESLLRGKRPSR